MSPRTAHYLTMSLSALNILAAPLQYCMDYGSNPDALCLTHKICNQQAIKILREQKAEEIASILDDVLPWLQTGVVWADLEFKNINHFFNPWTQKGLWRFSPARYIFTVYLTKASRLAKKENFPEAFFYLGAAAHILQDMSVPHHVCGHLFNGHKRFENWTQSHIKELIWSAPAIPCIKPLNLMLFSAKNASTYMSLVNENASEDAYAKAAQILLPIAQSSSAALFKWFIKTKILACH